MKKGFLVFLVLLSAFLASRWLFKPGYFTMHDDLQMMRQLQMEKCFQDKQVPCRWVPDMGYGYGYPLFNFYPPLPYYIGQVFRWLGFSFTWTVKLLFALQFFLPSIIMFFLAADLWGGWGGLLSAVFYTWAPYHSVDVYVRGAMNEAWAFIWFPLIFWASKKLIEKENFKYLAWLAFSSAMLLLTHSVMAIVFVPAVAIWVAYWMFRFKKFPWQNWQQLGKFFLAGIWALGLAAFFILPMFFEKKYVHLETMFSGYYDWRAHFVSLYQLFITRFWGYGPSVWGPEDGMPFPVGHLHWILGAVLFSVVIIRFLTALVKSKKPIEKDHWLVVGLFGGGLFYAFLAHQRSTFIWKLLPLLQIAQFPWRLLIGTAFLFSLLAGAVAVFSKSRMLILLLCFFVVVFNWNYFRPESMGSLPDEDKFSGLAWQTQQTAAIYDYLPKSARKAADASPEEDWLFDGSVEPKRFERGTNWFLWKGLVDRGGKLQISALYFPGWRAWIDGEEIEVNHEEELGRMWVVVPRGEHEVYFRFTNTPIRDWANLLSLLSWWALLSIVLGPKLWRLIIKK